MDQHPIPQDVTGFQFKLIGTMTVKQFGFVASGVVMAVILYYIPLHSAIGVLAKVMLIPLLGASGVVVAFVPIDGRPIDVMATNFFKALFSPNQYVYRRQGKKLSFSTMTTAKPQVAKKTAAAAAQTPTTAGSNKQLNQKEEKLRALLLSSQSRVKNDLDRKEVAFLKTLSIPEIKPAVPSVAGAPSTTPVAPPPMVSSTPSQAVPLPAAAPAMPTAPATPAVTPTPVLKTAPTPVQAPQPTVPTTSTQAIQPAPSSNAEKQQELEQKETQLEQQLTQAKQEEANNQTPPLQQAAHQKVEELSQQIEEIHSQKQQLEKELAQLKTQLAAQKGTPVVTAPQPIQTAQPLPAAPATPTAQPAKVTQDPQHVRAIPQSVTKKAGLPHVSDTPNVVVGIVKDPRGNVLANILVEVKDKDSNPVRAFKTNALGQFASATPLSTGVYTIELEDPKKQQRFDTIQINANNQILLPIEIISHDAREDLRKQLFAS